MSGLDEAGRAAKKKIRGGIVTNLDIELDDKKRSELDRDEWNDHVIAQVDKEDSKQYLGEQDLSKPLDITHDQLLHDDAAKKKDDHRITPISHAYLPDGTLVWVLNQHDEAAIHEGRFCPNCLEPQESRLTVECQFKGKDYGCGFKQKLR